MGKHFSVDLVFDSSRPLANVKLATFLLKILDSSSSCFPLEVTQWRVLHGLDADMGKVASDSWGLKRMFTLQLRRWLTGAKRPRVTCLKF